VVLVLSIDNKVISILSDYDGTLCSTSNVDQNGDLGYLPKELEEVLYDISHTIPICIVSSKDFSFLYKRTNRFSRTISCILGMETIFLRDKGKEDNNPSTFEKVTNSSFLNSYELYHTIPTEFRHLLVEASTLRENSIILTELANYIENKIPSIKIDKKYLTVEKDLLGGITIDWRADEQEEWKTNSKIYKKILKKGLYRIITKNASIKNLSNKHLDYHLENLFIQEYSTHPFIDIYSSKIGKEAAYDCIVSEIYNRKQKLGKVIYLGDSENDNPAFKQADISIGIYSNDITIPNLSCKYYLKYDNLPSFLRNLSKNNFIFCEAMIK
jgi:HAD superfamily hydrolase (TIGR01484 family)